MATLECHLTGAAADSAPFRDPLRLSLSLGGFVQGGLVREAGIDSAPKLTAPYHRRYIAGGVANLLLWPPHPAKVRVNDYSVSQQVQ
jgi:hypothetical protein